MSSSSFRRLHLAAKTSLAALCACSSSQTTPGDPAPVPTSSASLSSVGINPALMDTSADPCVDFYQLGCGLVEGLQIPPDRSAWGPTYELIEGNEKFLREFLEESARGPGEDPVRGKLGAWYGACMNEDAIERAGITPLEPLFAVIRGVKDTQTLYQAIIALHRYNIYAVFDITAQQDFADATLMIAGLDQSGLGLPDRDYYLVEGEADVRAFYLGHVTRMFQLAGDKEKDAKEAAAQVMRIETALAKLSQDKVTRRDPYAVYHKMDRKTLANTAKKFPWDNYFAGLGFPGIQDISLNSIEYFVGADELLTSEKPAAWRNYLRWRVLSTQADRLTKAFVDESFKLYQRLLGQEELEPRWRRCVDSTDIALGELLAQPFVAARFDAASKQEAEALLLATRAAMNAELDLLDWMDAPTRAAAREKLQKMKQKIGYPPRWRSYDFAVSPNEYAKNSLAAETFDLKYRLNKVGKPIDRDFWQMTPPTVNAYYDASLNEMVFPAGILQPPFFDKSFLPAVNYGATAATMGHELTHGFDDEGSEFDGSGNLRKWWSEGTRKAFEAQTQCVIDQYGQYEAVPGVKLNGALSAGENIADIGGVKLAFNAFREARKAAKQNVVAGGYNEDQLFFIAYAQSWCQKTRPELLELIAKTDPHSPNKYRVNGVVANLPAFAEAFGCKKPEKVCAVW